MSAEIMEWCRNVVGLVKDGGVWMIPRSGLVFRVDRTSQTLTLVAGDASNDDMAATTQNFAAIGWRVTQ